MPVEVRLLQDDSADCSKVAQWEQLVQSAPESGFMQSCHWQEVKLRQGLPSFRLGAFQHESLIGGAIFYTSTKRNGAGILVAPEGPILPWQDYRLSTEALKAIVDAAQAKANELGAMAMRIEPRLCLPVPPALREFGRAPVDLIPCETLYIDLSVSRQEMLESMKPKGRYNIAVSQRRGITVSQDNSENAVQRLYSVLQQASERDDFALEPLEFFQPIHAVLTPRGHARFLFAEHDGETLAAMLLVTYGSRATYLYGGITNEKRNLMAGYALQWEAMQIAKSAGCRIYDFYGFNQFRAPHHAYSRFSQFKGQFGGQVMRFIGAQDFYFLDNLTDAFIKVVNETRTASCAGSL